MYVQPWSKAEPRTLARYVTPEAVRFVVLPNASTLSTSGDFCALCREVFEAARALSINYSLEGYDPRAEVQQIRTPADVASAPRQGTCLDLAAFYAGLCLGFDLLPYLVILENHALVVVSTAFGRRDWSAYGRAERERFADGLLNDAELLRQLVDDGNALAIECTGLAHSDDPAAMGLDTAGRTTGGMSFDAATTAGRSRLDQPLRFALDVAELQYRWQLTPFAAVDPELLGQVIEQLGARFDIKPAAGALPPVRLRERLAKLFERHSLFGGRDRELAALDAFLAEYPSGYAFVTARSGFGKSALIANWVRSLEARGQRVAYHFISRTDGVADQDTTLRSLCQQLIHAYGLRGDLPHSVQELRSLYTTLLSMPAPDGVPMVIVLDGLDEAEQWEPALGSDLFPRELPHGVHLLFSARDVADRDWPAALELESADVFRISLTTLGLGEIESLLRAAGDRGTRVAADATFVAAALNRSQGDPFYLQYLAQDVRSGVIKTTDDVRRHPQGLNAYLDKWWDDVSRVVGERAVSDLLGYLLVGKGPLSRRDLTDISQTDALSGMTFRRTLDLVRRYLVGSDATGYMLCHPRFRDYVASQVGEAERGEYLNSLIGYCERWPTHRSAYALQFLPAHLMERGRRGDLLELFSPEWIAATWRELKTFVSLVRALGIATQACLQEPPLFDAIPGLALARQTALELMEFPPDLLAAWVALGQADRAVQVVDSLGDARGRAAESAVALAGALLRSSHSAEDLTNAGNLLLRAAGLLPLRRNTSYMLETLSGLRPHLKAGLGLDEARRHDILRTVEQFAGSGRSAELAVIALGITAEAWGSSSDGSKDATRLLDQAILRLKDIEASTDKLVTSAFLVPALRLIRPESVAPFMEEAFKSVEDPFHGSSLYMDPMSAILDNWRPANHPDDFGERSLIGLCNRLLEVKFDGSQAGRLANELAAIGRPELAVSFLEKVWDAPPNEAALAVLSAIPMSGGADPKSMLAMFERAVQTADSSHESVTNDSQRLARAVAASAARFGHWQLATSTLGRLPAGARREPIIQCLRAASTAGMKGDTLVETTRSITQLAEELKSDEQIAIMATAALMLAQAGLDEAGPYAARCSSLCLRQSPEGDTDVLWKMVAIAEAMGGDVEGACRTIRRMHWNGQRGPALASIAKLAADNPEALLLIAAEMETLIGGEKVTLYEDGLIAVLNSLEPFVRNTPEQAERLLDNAWTSIGGMSNRWMVCRCAQAEINARAKLNRDVAVAHLELLLNWLESPPQRPSIGAAELNSIISAANALATGDTRWAATIEARARALLKSITAVGEGGDSSELIGLTAVVNPVRAAIELTRQVGSIRELAKAGPSSIENFRRMVSELTGARYSPRNRQIDAITQAAGSVVQLDQIDTDAAESILDHLIEVTTTNLSGDDLGDALQSVIRMLGAREARLLGLFAERIAAVAAGMHDSEDSANRVRHALASTLGETGHLGLADRVVADMPPGDLHDDAATLVEAFRELKALGELSPLEQDFLLGDDSNLKRITVILLRKETKPGELLHAAANAVIERAAMLDRIKIMGTFAPIMLLPAYSNGGPKLMNMIVDGVEGWDHRFEEAARLIGDVA